MKKKLSFLSLVAIVFILMIISSYVIYFVVLDKTIDEVFYDQAYIENNEIANSAVDFLDAKIGQEIDTIIGIEVAHHNLIGVENQVFDREYYETLISNSEYIRRIEVLNLSRDVIYSSDDLSNRVGINISDYYLFDDLVDIHKLAIGKVVYTPHIDELTVEVAYSGEDCIITGLISIDFFREYGDSYKNSFSDKEVMILNAQGKYIYDSYGDQHLIQNYYSDFYELVQNDNANELYIYEINGHDCIVNIEHLNINDWVLVVYESTDSALSLNVMTNNYYSTIIVITFVLSLSIMGYIFSWVLKDYRLMIRIIGNVSDGIFGDDMKDSKIRELSVLRSGFNKMKNKLRESTSKLEYLAYHDELTGLSTKNKAVVEFKEIRDHSESIAFLYIDINRFEVFNENYGYEFGDSALQYVSTILKSYLDKLYRVQSDEFLGLLLDKSKEEIEEIVEKINSIIAKGIEKNTTVVDIKLNMGISIYPENGLEFDELIQKSILATREVKSKSGDKVMFFNDAHTDRYLRQSNIELRIKQALENDEFNVVYQPIVSAETGEVKRFEALSRWKSPELGVVGPYEFIPILERNHDISMLDKLVISKTMKFNKLLTTKHHKKLIACVNVSVETIMRPDFIDFIDDQLKQLDYDPTQLEIEITESTIIKDFEGITKKMKYLRAKGVRFSEDDFGDGYSSFTYLTKLEIDTLKISRGFLLNVLENKESIVLINTILYLAKKLNFTTVVEGVEDEEALTLFKERGCDFIQGYLFYKPMPENELIEIVIKSEWKEF